MFIKWRILFSFAFRLFENEFFSLLNVRSDNFVSNSILPMNASEWKLPFSNAFKWLILMIVITYYWRAVENRMYIKKIESIRVFVLEFKGFQSVNFVFTHGILIGLWLLKSDNTYISWVFENPSIAARHFRDHIGAICFENGNNI